jgi:LPS export ABC transporter protein LptC
MASWQKRARTVVAVFGLVFAGIVYSAIRERAPVVAPEPVRRADPKAIAETYSAVLKQLTGGEQPYEISAERSQQYDDGSSRLFGVAITVRNRRGRDYVITAREAYAGKGQADLRLTGAVKVAATDGFELTTEEATFDQNTGIARATGPVAYRKGRMSGSGIGMMYDQPNDVLRFDSNARVLATNEEGETAVDFTAGAATLDRVLNLLTLEETVHVVRDEQVIDADRIRARLTDSDDIVTYLELRGNARVSGGSTGIASMSARDIDLDYTDDGETLERVVLDGAGTMSMTGTGGSPGREMAGEHLDLRLASDASLTSATGSGGVRVRLPPAAGARARSIEADAFEATGAAGQGLTDATFTSAGCGLGSARARCVLYLEADATPESSSAGRREARSTRLVVTLADDAVTSATFSGLVGFSEQALEASAANAVYAPGRGTLRLTGRDAGGGPHVDEEQVTIDAEAIDVSLDSRRMTATGSVQTDVRAGPTADRAGAGQRASKMPRLLKADEAVHVSADGLEYQGAGGTAVYTGNAILSQGTSTTIRGRTITLDRANGDLLAIGNAVSRLLLDAGPAVGRAHEIRYDDMRRTITYSASPVPPTSGAAAGTAPSARVQVNIPDGDVTAERVEIVLAPEGSALERLEAYTGVSVTAGTRRATGARLTYHASEGRYVMNSAPGVPLRILDRSSNSCSETTGSTLTFFKGTDRMTVDGKEAMRTQTKGGGPCGPIPLSR